MSAPTQFLSELVALFGQPVAENPTQYMHERAFAALGLPWRYITMQVPPDRLAGAVTGLRAMNFAGANCTIPHKIAVIQHLDSLTDTARKIGAVNTIVRQADHTLLGENTDGKGFIMSVREAGLGRRGGNDRREGGGNERSEGAGQGQLPGVRAVVLGAGGAARAIAVELAVAGASEITIVNRTPASGEQLAAEVAQRTGARTRFLPWFGDFAVPPDTQLLVNATSIALFPEVEDVVPVDYGTIRPGLLVCDVIPNRPDTPFLQRARAAGATTLDGLGMLVYQGAIAFKMWTGHEAPVAVMRAALEEVFG